MISYIKDLWRVKMKSINILHLSDLHISDKNKQDIEIILQALVEDVKKFKQRGKTIDFICFTGDMIYSGDNSGEELNLALDYFINPLLSEVKLPEERFLIIPGNHDIDRTKIENYAEKGLKSELTNTQAINHFMDNIEGNNFHFERTKHIKEFTTLFIDKPDWEDPLNYTKKYIVNDAVIGFACFDSAWRSSGDNDRRNLIIGEREVDKALRSIENADVKIALVHHPFDWLVEDDERSILPLFSKFQLVLNGHVHDLGDRKITSHGQSTIYSSCGALFSGDRSSYNGYNFIEVNPKLGSVKINLREYFNSPRRRFDAALSRYEKGEVRYNFDIKDSTISKALEIITNVKPTFYENTSDLLVSNMIDMEAPKDLNNIYILPELNEESNYKRTSYEESDGDKVINLEELLESKDNILFIGQEEVGKTTLLHYITNLYLSSISVNYEVPFYIDFIDLPSGKDPLERQMIKFTVDNFEGENTPNKSDIKNLLTKGRCVILIDNLNLSKQKHIERLNDFMTRYPDNRFIFTAQEDVFRTIASDLPSFENEVKEVYIRTLSKSGVRQLIEKWFIDKNIDIDSMLDRIMYYLNNVGMPRTPLVVSLILATCRQYEDFIPINEANVMENFMQVVFEKLTVMDSRSNTFDFHSKERFLWHLSWEMAKGGKNWVSLTKFTDFTSSYHETKGLSLQKSKFDQLFFEKGILLKKDDKVFYRYKSIQEYYLAKAALNDMTVFEFVMKEDNYYKHINVINFYTGIKRDELVVINFLKEQLTKELDPLMDKVYLLENYGLDGSILPDSNEIGKRKALDTKQRDQLTNLPDKSVENQPEEIDETEKINKTNFFEILSLYGRTIRNSENIEIIYKKEHLKYCYLGYVLLLAVFKETLENTLSELESSEENIIDGRIDKFKSLMKFTIPFILQNIAYESIGTSKLEETLKELINEEVDEFIRFMMVFLYSDLKLEKYLLKIKKLISSTKNKDILFLIKAKLQLYYMMNHSNDKQELLSLMSEAELKTGKMNRRLKSTVMDHIETELKQTSNQL